MILVARFFVPKGYSGITLFPFILLKSKESKSDLILLNHEQIHLKQQLEMLIIPFFLWYGLEFCIRLMHKRNWQHAYRSISLEQEAYSKQEDLDYLKSRSFWNFLNYL